jgi:ribosomal protein S18 acetylase RimI-like enzyme
MIVIREAVSHDMHDVNALVGLAYRRLRQIYRPTEAALSNKAGLDAKLLRLVALVDGVIVGTLQFHATGDRLHIVGLAVHPAHQRAGIARALIESLHDRAPLDGVSRLSLFTVKETGNVPIFERLGFSVVSERPDTLAESDVYDQLTDVYMERIVG